MNLIGIGSALNILYFFYLMPIDINTIIRGNFKLLNKNFYCKSSYDQVEYDQRSLLFHLTGIDKVVVNQ